MKDATAATCEWIWNHPEYQSHSKSTRSSIIHVLGKEGSGKTVLTNHVRKGISTELSNSPESDKCALLYYYCSRSIHFEETASSILRALIHQLLQIRNTLFGVVTDSDNAMVYRPFSKMPAWSFEALYATFKAIVINSGLQNIHCIIDGLDECEKESTENFLSLLVRLVDQDTNGVTLKLFLTSRDEGYIEQCLRSCASRIKMDPAVVTQDIDHFVHEEMSRLGLAQGKERHIRQVLVSRAEGTFLWAKLALKIVEDYRDLNVKELLDLVQTLPLGLNALYDHMLRKMDKRCDDPGDAKLVRKILTWIIFAMRPLTLAEMKISLAIELNCQDMASVDPLVDVNADLLNLCGSFLHIVQANRIHCSFREHYFAAANSFQSKVNRDLSATVHFIHRSAREYLMNVCSNSENSSSKFHIRASDGHAKIAQICLTYLLFRDFEAGPVVVQTKDYSDPQDATALRDELLTNKLESHDFLEYATLHWPTHTRESLNLRAGHHVLDLAHKFLVQSKSRRSWYQVYAFLRRSKSVVRAPTPSKAVLRDTYLICMIGFQRLVSPLASYVYNFSAHSRATYYPYTKSDNSSPSALHVASILGLNDIAKLLLDRGATTQAKDEDGWTPLHYGAYNGHLDITRLLLDYEDKCDSKDNYASTPLHCAAHNGRLEVTKLLLERGAPVDSRDDEGWTALQIASYHGHLDVVRLLVDQEKSVENERCYRWTALHCAAGNGQLEVVRLLLDRKASINERDEQGWAALHHAVHNGQLEVIRLLLDRNASINERDKEGWAALHHAARNGQLEVIRLLLDRNASINEQDKEGWAALHYAAYNGELEVIRLLLDRKASINERDEEGWSALHFAVSNGSLEVVSLLLDRKASIDAQDMRGLTALYYAVHDGHLEAVRLLINQGASINTRGNHGRTALHRAVHDGHLEVTRLLLDRGASIQEKDKFEDTALHLSARDGRFEIVQLLLDRGAPIDTRGKKKLSALHFAVQRGRLEVTRLLLDRGASIDARDYYGQTALHHAVQRKNLEVIDFLLDRGASIDAQDNYGLTVLSQAVEHDFLDMVILLLSRGASVNVDAEPLTALHQAARFGRTDIAQLLLDCGASTEAMDVDGMTPLLRAARWKEEKIVRLILAYGGFN